jgi:Glycoside-hydrolase family GH114
MRFVPLLLLVSACDSSDGGGGSTDAGRGDAPMSDGPSVMLKLPPVNAKFDYQLGGTYEPPAGVTVVVRERHATPAPDVYNICYVNGFQIEAADESSWVNGHSDLILRDGNGDFVVDPQSSQMLLDIRLAEKRTAIASIIGAEVRQCAQNSFNAVEIGHLDSYTHSQGLLNEQQAVYTMKMLADHAHAVGRPIAQNNASALAARKAELGTDFAIVEGCSGSNQCGTYAAGYGDHVLVLEHVQQDFDAACTAFPNLSVVLRDPDLVTPQSAAYVYDGC